MKCPACNIEGRIESSKHILSKGKLYLEQSFKCRNPKCVNYNRIFGTVRNEIPVFEDATETE